MQHRLLPGEGSAVWADGKKVDEQLTHAFSNYSFLDASVALAAGSHVVAAANTPSQSSGAIPIPFLTLFTGNSNRTLSYSTLATGECNGGAAIADLNGDGISDLAAG